MAGWDIKTSDPLEWDDSDLKESHEGFGNQGSLLPVAMKKEPEVISSEQIEKQPSHNRPCCGHLALKMMVDSARAELAREREASTLLRAELQASNEERTDLMEEAEEERERRRAKEAELKAEKKRARKAERRLQREMDRSVELMEEKYKMLMRMLKSQEGNNSKMQDDEREAKVNVADGHIIKQKKPKLDPEEGIASTAEPGRRRRRRPSPIRAPSPTLYTPVRRSRMEGSAKLIFKNLPNVAVGDDEEEEFRNVETTLRACDFVLRREDVTGLRRLGTREQHHGRRFLLVTFASAERACEALEAAEFLPGPVRVEPFMPRGRF